MKNLKLTLLSVLMCLLGIAKAQETFTYDCNDYTITISYEEYEMFSSVDFNEDGVINDDDLDLLFGCTDDTTSWNNENNESFEDDQLTYTFLCDDGNEISVSAYQFGMTDSEYVDFLNTDFNDDGYIDEADTDILHYILGCGIEYDDPEDNVSDSNISFTFLCNGESMTVTPESIGVSNDFFESLLENHDFNNNGENDADDLVILHDMFGCTPTTPSDTIINDQDLVYSFDCNGEVIEVDISGWGSQEEFDEFYASDINGDGEINDADIDFLHTFFGCSDADDNTGDGGNDDETLYLVICDGDSVYVTSSNFGMTDDELIETLAYFNEESGTSVSLDEFLALIMGCDEGDDEYDNGDASNEEDVEEYESYTFNCDGVLITITPEDLNMPIDLFSSLVTSDLNNDGVVNDADLSYLFSCDSVQIDWENIFDNGAIPPSFMFYMIDMLENGNSDINWIDFLSNNGTAVGEYNSTIKRLIGIRDVLGREVKFSPNQTLFYIFSDGSVKKQMVLVK